MSTQDRFLEDMKAAMKAGETGKLRLSVIRMVRAALKNAEIDRRHALAEDEVLEILAKEIKQRRDAIIEFAKGARQDLIQLYEAEIAVLTEYLPQQMSADEIRKLVSEAIAKTGAAGPKDMGKVMGALVPQTRGRADGRLVNQLVKEMLGQ